MIGNIDKFRIFFSSQIFSRSYVYIASWKIKKKKKGCHIAGDHRPICGRNLFPQRKFNKMIFQPTRPVEESKIGIVKKSERMKEREHKKREREQSTKSWKIGKTFDFFPCADNLLSRSCEFIQFPPPHPFPSFFSPPIES